MYHFGVELQGTNSSQISGLMLSEEFLYLKSVFFLSLLSFGRESSSAFFFPGTATVFKIII